MSFAERGRGTHDRSREICSAAGIKNVKIGKVSMPFRDFFFTSILKWIFLKRKNKIVVDLPVKQMQQSELQQHHLSLKPRGLNQRIIN